MIIMRRAAKAGRDTMTIVNHYEIYSTLMVQNVLNKRWNMAYGLEIFCVTFPFTSLYWRWYIAVHLFD